MLFQPREREQGSVRQAGGILLHQFFGEMFDAVQFLTWRDALSLPAVVGGVRAMNGWDRACLSKGIVWRDDLRGVLLPGRDRARPSREQKQQTHVGFVVLDRVGVRPNRQRPGDP